MAKKYTPKKIDVVYEAVKEPIEMVQARINDAFDILFEETLKFLNEQNTNQIRQIPNYQIQKREGVIINA